MTRTNLIRQNKKPTVHRGITKYVLFVVAGVLAVSSIFMTVESATSGVEVSNLRQREIELAAERRNLENTLVRSLSMSDLEQKSSEMGYVKPANLVYVSDSKEAVAKLP